MSWLSTEILCLSDGVDFLSLLAMYLPVFLVLLVCVCVCVCVTVCTGRQTDTVKRLAKQYQHTHAHTHAEITRTPLSCGGDECDAESLSLLIHIYIHSHTSMHVCLFAFLSIPDSWLPNSLLLLDTGGLVCLTTSCRPCHPTFFPGFHRLGVCVCLSWLSTEILCLSDSLDFLSLLAMHFPEFLVLFACVCVCVCVTVCTGRQTDTVERLAK